MLQHGFRGVITLLLGGVVLGAGVVLSLEAAGGGDRFAARQGGANTTTARAASPAAGMVLAAGETAIESAVRSVGLFKNGYAVVRRTVEIDGAGRYVATDVPVPVHGTFWIESAFPVDARVTERERVGAHPGRPEHDLQGALEGRHVAVELRGKELPVHGQVLAFSEEEPRDDERVRDLWSTTPVHSQPVWAQNARFLVLETAEGVSFIDSGQIVRIDTSPLTKKRRDPAPALVFEADEVPSGGGSIEIVYLTRGISWAPSYRIDLGEDAGPTGTLTIEQQALIRNELEQLKGVEIELISGFPSIEFAHVVSPMAAVTDWKMFFGQLGGWGGSSGSHAMLMNSVSQVVNYGGGSGGGAPIVPSADGIDTHYQSIGSRQLGVGESLVVSVDRATAEYERIVEWTVPDSRNEYGRSEQRPEDTSHPWDAVRFDNPFGFPMTTAAATVMSGGRFRGQRMSEWVNVGEKTTLPITKALSVRAVASEVEEPNSRGHREVAGRSYRDATVRGELVLCNHRTEAVTMVIRRQFSGQLLEGDREPEVTLRQEGVASINPRHELVWTLTLPPGEPQTITYRYEVLVLR